MRVLVVNAGSSSLKLRVLGPGDEVLADQEVERWDGDADHADITSFVTALTDLDAVGHRVVHGGGRFRAATVLDDDVVASIEALTPLAPLHQPRALAGIRATAKLLPDVLAVACFDTAFHSTLPAAAATYALPAEWNERFGLRRYGFHGLSHAWASRRAAELLGRPVAGLRLVTAHLGAGASLCAVEGGRSVATTMGFTPLEGLVMATRSGDVDPGLLLWLEQQGGLTADEVADGLEHRAGLVGLSRTSGDMRDVLSALDDGDARSGKRIHLLGSSAFAAGDDRARVTHAAPGRRRLSGDEADDRLLEVRLDPRGGLFFRAPADLADHDHGLGFLVAREQFQRVDVRRNVRPGIDDRYVALAEDVNARPFEGERSGIGGEQPRDPRCDLEALAVGRIEIAVERNRCGPVGHLGYLACP